MIPEKPDGSDIPAIVLLGRAVFWLVPSVPVSPALSLVFAMIAATVLDDGIFQYITTRCYDAVGSVSTSTTIVDPLLWIVAALLAFAYLTAIIAMLWAGAFLIGRARSCAMRLRPAIRQARLTYEQRRWVFGAARHIHFGSRRTMPNSLRTKWPGPGLVGIGVRHEWFPHLEFASSEGMWIRRVGIRAVIQPGAGICLALGIGLVSLAIFGATGPAIWRPSVTVFALTGITWLVHFMVFAGWLFRGWFDAHIDAGSIDFAGPWNSQVFPRKETLVILVAAGPFAEAILIHQSGRRARLLLNHDGVQRILSGWS